MQALFQKPDQYDAMLTKGIGITGNDKHYFIDGRIRLVINQLQGVPKRILDFGCGIGDTALKLAHRFPEATVVGSDLAKEAVAYARENAIHPNLMFQTDDELDQEEPFDLVYVNCVFHHVPPGLREQVAMRLYHLTKPGGTVWIFENNPANPGTQLAMFTNPFDEGVVKVWPEGQRQLLRQPGFTVTNTWFLFYFPQWLSWLRPLEKYLKRVPLGGQYGVFARRPV